MDYYKVLQISNAASQDDIRKSFRYLALKYHPDRNKNSEESKQKFMQVVEAYKVLSDEQARKNYDIGATTIANNNEINQYHRVHYGSYNYNPVRRWTLSSNSCEMYSYADIKRRYIQNPIYDAHTSTMSLSLV
ncbi:MAG TPA: DnaJ domain-containing protein [Nitrososphaeraceae archaeon]|jgi:DnaJ-class molecular chaperone|nr:DnaJ domain-containing protein [Nitrososphaeraceae archaeon]